MLAESQGHPEKKTGVLSASGSNNDNNGSDGSTTNFETNQPPTSFYEDRSTLSWVVLLYLTYPTCVKQALAMLACEQVGDKLWLAADLEEPCMEGRHLVFFVLLCLPQILLWLLGLPCASLCILYKNKKNLMDERIQFKWGLLFSGYRHEVWWWEMTIVIRKVCMVVVGGVFGSHLGPDMQVYMALFLVVIFIVVHLAAKPFDELTPLHQTLHWLELGALLICWGTLYSGMLFWLGTTSGRLGPEFLTLVSFTIIFGNVLFTIWLVVVFVRAVHRESKKDGEHSEEALRRLVRVRSEKKPAKATSAWQDESTEVEQHGNVSKVALRFQQQSGEREEGRRSVRVVPASHAQHEEERSTLKKEIVALKWQKNIRRTLTKNSNGLNVSGTQRRMKRNQTWRTQRAEEIQSNHEKGRTLALKHIERRHSKRRVSLQARVDARNKKKEGGGMEEVGRSGAVKHVSKLLASEKMLKSVRLQQRIQRIKEVQMRKLKEKRLAKVEE